GLIDRVLLVSAFMAVFRSCKMVGPIATGPDFSYESPMEILEEHAICSFTAAKSSKSAPSGRGKIIPPCLKGVWSALS
ncbi:MAG: hypothetical protein WBH10_02075, partial [Allopontixanthobacter sediminis]